MPRFRRRFLRLCGSATARGLAGCQEAGSSDEATSSGSEQNGSNQPGTPVAADTPEATVHFDTAIAEGDAALHLRVSGRVTAPNGIDRVAVSAGEQTARFDADLSVTGGRAYQVTVTVVDADGTEFTNRRETDHVPIAVDPLETDRVVGAHYYPWYNMHEGHLNWTDRSVSTPVLGEYTADERAIVDQHIKWSVEHGITWWSVSWWGPNSDTDRVLRETILEADPFEHLQFSILYETKGRLGDFDYDLDSQGARTRLANDLAYLADTYFDRDNYRHVDGRPLVFFYIGQELRGDVAGAFAEATADLDTDLYVLADVPFGGAPTTYPVADVADAVTSYNPYTAQPDIEEVFHDKYERGLKTLHLGADAAGFDYVPVLTPGYDDTGLPASIREDNPVLSASPDRYERVCEQARPHLADAESVLVTSFNEWYENTQIEPSETHGTAYLELTRNRVATGSSPGYDPTGEELRFVFNETIVPADVNPDSSDHRELAFMASGLEFRDGDDTIVAYDIGSAGNEPVYLGGAYFAVNDGSDTWRWLGGPDSDTVLFVETDLSGADTAVLTGQPMRSDRIEADLYVGDTKTDHVAFGNRDGEFDDYEFSLSG